MAERARALALVAALALLASCARTGAPTPASYHLGRTATTAEVAADDISVAPDGNGLPAGSGDAGAGARLYAARCANCHGASIAFPASRWPYATTIFDYVRRAMPPDRSKALRADEAYALTAYLLAANGAIDAGTVLTKSSLPTVVSPRLHDFVRGTNADPLP